MIEIKPIYAGGQPSIAASEVTPESIVRSLAECKGRLFGGAYRAPYLSCDICDNVVKNTPEIIDAMTDDEWPWNSVAFNDGKVHAGCKHA